jgi:membrane peptidoglycan carboxypeptidase
MPELSSAPVGEASHSEGSASVRSSTRTLQVKPRRALRRIFLFLGGLFAVVVVAAAFAAGLMLSRTPSPKTAVALVKAQAAAHGTAYPGPAAPRRFAKALLATEDHRFFSPLDPGLDPVAVVRVAIGMMMGLRGDLGGSTIEQQLAKMLYTPHRRSFSAKLEQVAIGIKLRFTYSKSEILAMYAEVVYFGDHYYGLQNASCGYFGKRPADLSWAQAAMLAGVVNGPSLFDPREHPDNAQRRQEHVFDRLVAVGDLSEQQAKDALAEPLGLIAAHCETPAARCCPSRSSSRS